MRVTRKPRSARKPRSPDGIRHGNVELRHLRYFVVAAEELNLRRAARRLEITQPALTKQVAGLEEQMGVSLFARQRHRLAGLTSAGTEFLAEARQILDQVEDAIRGVQLVAHGRSGRLRIGFTDDAATLALTSVLAAFHVRSPNVLVELVELSGSEVLTALHSNTIDLVLASEPQDADGFAIEKLWRESWSVVLPEDHPLCRKDAVVPADLAGEALALIRSSAQKTVLARLRRLGKKSDWPRVAFRVADRRTAIMLARAGSAIALAPSSSVLVAGLRAVMRPLLQDPGYAVIALTHDIDPPPGLIGRFLNVAREVSGARSSKDQPDPTAAGSAERAVLCATCRRVRINARSVRINRSSMGGTMRSTVTGLVSPDPTASA
jgi:LysR family transcriptional regulator, benzoate and cis,cis-muconate-responsive activator of ben and cat genes